MNILFVLYNDFNCNSAGHVHSFANELVELGHDCEVAVPFNKASLANLPSARYRGIDFEEGRAGRFTFANGLGPDLVHAWTPREVVRQFCRVIQERHRSKLFVHLEDNEWHLLTCALGMSLSRLFMQSDKEIDRLVHGHLFHPRKGPEFLASADGVTVIIDRLTEFVPKGVPTLELWPAADPGLFRPYPRTQHARTSLGIPMNSVVITYTGNVHGANAHEVRSLYLAVAVLNREGFPTTLVRTGKDYAPFLGPGEEWGRRNAVELGLVKREELPKILAVADVLVQPGRSDSFNDYRFPSKLPEFLSAGRPVIVPNANIASRMIHRKHAFILSNASALAIASAVREIVGDPALCQQLAKGATEFVNEHLSWERSTEKLDSFYQTCRADREQIPIPLDLYFPLGAISASA